jgi:hypothetical protein
MSSLKYVTVLSGLEQELYERTVLLVKWKLPSFLVKFLFIILTNYIFCYF